MTEAFETVAIFIFDFIFIVTLFFHYLKLSVQNVEIFSNKEEIVSTVSQM